MTNIRHKNDIYLSFPCLNRHTAWTKSLFVIVALFLLTSDIHAQYLPPMPIKPLVSGSFAEMRANHFHSGLDLTTSGATGIEVRAVEKGYISRIKVSAYNYGYAVYITHPDGNTTVYAHLKKYASKIDEVIRSEQYRRKSFEIDYFPKADLLPVSRGEVIGYSGNSGSSGGPHLHFEVRDTKSEEPLNPLAYLPPIADDQMPTIYGVKLFSRDDNAQVEGKHRNKYFTLAEINGQTIEVFGNVGFGVHAVDYLVAGHRPCGVVDIKLFCDDEVIFHSHIDRFSFDVTRHINSHIDYAEYVTNKRFVQKSFVDPGNKLEIYHVHKPLHVAEGEIKTLRYLLTDFAGNTNSVSFKVRGMKNENAQRPTRKGEYVAWGKTWSVDTLGMSIIIPHESLYEDAYIEISASQHKYTVGSEQIPLQKNATIKFPVPEELKKYGKQLFVGNIKNKGILSYAGGTLQNDVISLKTRSLGTFTLAVDTVAPKVFSKNTRTSLVASNSIMVGVTDDKSGIADYKCYIDDVWHLFEYDYKRSRLITNVGVLGLQQGKHMLRVVVSDNCGNTTEWQWLFEVR